MNVLVTGGAGYIGSHMVKLLRARGWPVVVVDDLSTGHRDAVDDAYFVECDVADADRVAMLLSGHRIGAVIYFAASSLVAGSVSEPINPYGASKLMVERILDDLHAAHGLRSVSLRYFNAAGADPQEALGTRHDPATHLIPLVLQAAWGRRPAVSVFGTDIPTRDGSCVRDYIHVADLCSAHLLALQWLESGGGREKLNLGTGSGPTVLEVVAAVERETGVALRVNRDLPESISQWPMPR